MSDDKTLLIQRIRDGSIDKSKDLIEADLGGADLSKADLRDANLRDANLRDATLTVADLRDANLIGADLHKANLIGALLSGVKLRGAYLNGAFLIMAKLRGALLSYTDLSESLLCGADLRETDLSRALLSRAELTGATLIGASLTGADLSKADLTEVFLSHTDLSKATLVGTQALGTDFTGAILTGVCIEDWNINSKTKLDSVICDYVYLKQNRQERRPPSGTFAPGDFAKLVQSSLETIDLIFREGLDWNAFAYVFKQIEVHYEDAQLAVQTIENKGDGVVIVKIATSPNADKEEIHTSFISGYEFASKELVAQYEARLQDKDKIINELFLLVKTQPIEIVKSMAEIKSGDTYHQPGAIIGINSAKAESGGSNNVTQNIIQRERQSLAEAVAEIQRLLTQLEETNPTATESEQVSYVNIAIKPDLRKRAIAALKAGTETAIDQFVLENKWLRVVKSVAKGWLKAES